MPVQRLICLAVLLCAAGAARADKAESAIESDCAAGRTLHAGGGEIIPAFDVSAWQAGAAPLCGWIARAALAVSGYYGRYPVPQVRLVLRPVDGEGVRGGTTYGSSDDGRPLIVIPLGRAVTPAQLLDDWTLTHEMVHRSAATGWRRASPPMWSPSPACSAASCRRSASGPT